MNEDVQDPFGYLGTPPRSPEHQFAVSSAVELSVQTSPNDGEDTPKAPLLPFAGRPQHCPGAPRKGRAPTSFFDQLSGEAPVRRLSFGAAGGQFGSCEPSEDMVSGSMEEDSDMPDQAHPGWQQPQLQPQMEHQQQQMVGVLPQQLQIPQHLREEQLLLSPSPPPVQQQLWTQQGMQQVVQQQQQHPPASMQQLFMPAQPCNRQLRPQQLWPCQPQQQQPPLWENPLSPAGRPRPPQMQGSTTPARLFR